MPRAGAAGSLSGSRSPPRATLGGRAVPDGRPQQGPLRCAAGGRRRSARSSSEKAAFRAQRKAGRARTPRPSAAARRMQRDGGTNGDTRRQTAGSMPVGSRIPRRHGASTPRAEPRTMATCPRGSTDARRGRRMAARPAPRRAWASLQGRQFERESAARRAAGRRGDTAASIPTTAAAACRPQRSVRARSAPCR